MDVLDRMGKLGHPEEECLERYVMKVGSEQETAEIEEHLLVCEKCRARFPDAQDWVSLMKSAIPLRPNRRRRRQIIPNLTVPPLALATGCAAIIAVAFAFTTVRLTPPMEETVTLTTTRGEAPASNQASSSHLLHLQLDTRDLTGPLECQVVDTSGATVWTKSPINASGDVKLDRTLHAGPYWVRINSAAGGHPTLREFQIELK